MAFYSARAIAHIIGVMRQPCNKFHTRSICLKPPCAGFRHGLCSGRAAPEGLASSGAVVGQLQTGTHQQEKAGLILQAMP